MKDLTQGSIANHIFIMAAPLAIGMLTQIAYQMIDLYFITRISSEATAGVNASGTMLLIVHTMTQVLGIGTVALVAQATGRKDLVDVNVVFNQSMLLCLICGLLAAMLAWALAYPYLHSICTNRAMIEAGETFTLWALPGYALSFPMIVLASALRGTGIVRPIVAVHIFTVTVNAVLAPVLIAGWGTGAALGVKGAGLATSISIASGTILLGLYFHRSQCSMTINHKMMIPQPTQWRRIITIGLPVGAEIALMILCATAVYYALRTFGPVAQAGYGIASRILQTALLPGMSIGFAVGPIIGQNFGAMNGERVKETFRKATLIGTTVMIMTGILVQWQSYKLVDLFDAEPSVKGTAVLFVELTSWSFVAQGLVYTCASTFQGLGNTVPSLISSGVCFVAFSIPLIWLSKQTEFQVEHISYLWILAIMLQSIVSLCLIRAEFRRRVLPIVSPRSINNTRTARSRGYAQ